MTKNVVKGSPSSGFSQYLFSICWKLEVFAFVSFKQLPVAGAQAIFFQFSSKQLAKDDWDEEDFQLQNQIANSAVVNGGGHQCFVF